MRKQFAKTLVDLGQDKRLVVLIGDISHFLLKDFQEKYPERFYNMGIAEQSMTGVAAGLSLSGFFPVVHSIAPFITERCFEQIKDDFCYQNIGVNLISVGSAFDYAALGCTHHCYDDIAILRALPNMQIIYPGSAAEFDALFRATYNNNSPKYFRLPQTVHNIKTNPKFGEVEKLADGSDLTVVATGPQLQNAYEAVNECSENGISCDLIYLTTIKPISEKSKEIIRQSIGKTRKLITIEEHSIIGGIGDEMAIICQDIGFIHKRLGIQDKFLTNYGSYLEHCRANGLTKEGIIKEIYEIKPKNNF